MMNRFVPQPGPPRGAEDNPYSDYKPPVEAGNRDEEKLMEHRPTQTTESLTPAERAELANFERSRALLNSIIAKSTDNVVSTHEGFPMPNDENSKIDIKDSVYEFEQARDPNKVPETQNSQLEINHSKYRLLDIGLRDLRSHYDTSNLLELGGDAVSIAIHLGGIKSRLSVDLRINGKVEIHVPSKSKEITGMEEVTDHAAKMAALDELYDVLSFVQADLPEKPIEDKPPEIENEVE